MKEYEISNNDKIIGKIKTFKNKTNLKNTIIQTNNGLNYIKKTNKNNQTYEIEYMVNNVDELFNIVSKYIFDNELVFEHIEKIKKQNNIKTIKNDTKIKIIIPEKYLEKLNLNKENIEYKSLIKSKVYFIKKVLETTNNESIINNLNIIINEYNNLINSSEYEFLTDEEKIEKNNSFIKRLDKIIENIENNTKYKYGENYIMPIKISNN